MPKACLASPRSGSRTRIGRSSMRSTTRDGLSVSQTGCTSATQTTRAGPSLVMCSDAGSLTSRSYPCFPFSPPFPLADRASKSAKKGLPGVTVCWYYRPEQVNLSHSMKYVSPCIAHSWNACCVASDLPPSQHHVHGEGSVQDKYDKPHLPTPLILMD